MKFWLSAIISLFLSATAVAQSPSEIQLLVEINNKWNRSIMASTDLAVWGVEDYWATPAETLQKGQGDCEDFAIGKMFSAIEAGISPAKLRLIAVELTHLNGSKESHMVLGYYASRNSEPLILDNLVSFIKPVSQRTDLAERLSIGFEGIFVNNKLQAPATQSASWKSMVSRNTRFNVALGN